MSIEQAIDDLMLIWLDSLRTRCAKSDETICDIGMTIQFLTVDITTKLLLGREVGCIKHNCDAYDIWRAIKTSNRNWQYLLFYIQLNPLFFYLARIPCFRRLSQRNGVGRLMRVGFIYGRKIVQDTLTVSPQIILRVADKNTFQEHVDPELMKSL